MFQLNLRWIFNLFLYCINLYWKCIYFCKRKHKLIAYKKNLSLDELIIHILRAKRAQSEALLHLIGIVQFFKIKVFCSLYVVIKENNGDLHPEIYDNGSYLHDSERMKMFDTCYSATLSPKVDNFSFKLNSPVS